MLHLWMDGRMAAEHRRELTSSASAAAVNRNDDDFMGREGPASGPTAVAAARPLGAGLHPGRGDGRLLRRPLGQQVGTWLIRAGTRLGGASMRTS